MQTGDREDLDALMQEWRLLSKKPLSVSGIYDPAAVTRMSRHIARSAKLYVERRSPLRRSAR
jgi:hypothetical protein